MSPRSRRAWAAVAVLTCLLAPSAASAQYEQPVLVAQIAQTEEPLDPTGGLPPLRDRFPGGSGTEPTPTTTPTVEPTATATETPEPTPTPTATAEPRDSLARTGSNNPPLFALGGLTLLGFGIALRLRLALDDARRGV